MMEQYFWSIERRKKLNLEFYTQQNCKNQDEIKTVLD